MCVCKRVHFICPRLFLLRNIICSRKLYRIIFTEETTRTTGRYNMILDDDRNCVTHRHYVSSKHRIVFKVLYYSKCRPSRYETQFHFSRYYLFQRVLFLFIRPSCISVRRQRETLSTVRVQYCGLLEKQYYNIMVQYYTRLDNPAFR